MSWSGIKIFEISFPVLRQPRVLFRVVVLRTAVRTLVDVPLAAALDHHVPELERLADVLEDRGRLIFVAGTDEVGLG